MNYGATNPDVGSFLSYRSIENRINQPDDQQADQTLRSKIGNDGSNTVVHIPAKKGNGTTKQNLNNNSQTQ